MKTEIELYIKVPVEFEYEAGEKETFHNPGWPESATWIDYDEKAVMEQIKAELDKPETTQSLVDVVTQEIREQAGEAAYEKWLDRKMANEALDRGVVMDTEEIIRKNNGDLAVHRDLKRLENLPYLTRQNILSSVGDAVLCDLVDGTVPTAEIIKGHLARACKFYWEV